MAVLKQPAGIEVDWAEFRRQMPVAERWSYFDHAAVAPLSGPARDALIAWAQQAAADGDVPWMDWCGKVEELRRVAADMIGAQPEEIALVRNTTEGINLVADGFPWQAGDNVVILADEFPSNQYPWMNLADRGVETRRVPTDDGVVDLDRLAAACDNRTRIVSASWVSYSSGWRNDVAALAEIAHRRGALLFLDAIQGLGVFSLDVAQTGVDFLAADGHKWMLGPEGAGIFYLRHEHLPRLRPMNVGWNSVKQAHDFSRVELDLKETAARYEGGSQNVAGMIALLGSLQLLRSFGTAAIAPRVLQIADLARGRLAELGAVVASDHPAKNRSGIVLFTLPGKDSRQVCRRCLDDHVVLSCRAGRLRISPHAYNNADDVARLIQALS